MQIILEEPEVQQILQERFKRYGKISQIEVTNYSKQIKIWLEDTKVPEFKGEPLPIE